MELAILSLTFFWQVVYIVIQVFIKLFKRNILPSTSSICDNVSLAAPFAVIASASITEIGEIRGFFFGNGF